MGFALDNSFAKLAAMTSRVGSVYCPMSVCVLVQSAQAGRDSTMSDDSDATLDPDQESDVTLPPSDEDTIPASPQEKLSKRKSLPYQFKKTTSSVHAISDSEDDEPRKKPPLSKPKSSQPAKPSLPQKQSTGSSSNRSLHVISDSESDDESRKLSKPRSSLIAKPSLTAKPSLPQKQSTGSSSNRSLHVISDSESDGDSRRKNESRSVSKPKAKLSSKGNTSKDSLGSLHLISDSDSDDGSAKKRPSGDSSKNLLNYFTPNHNRNNSGSGSKSVAKKQDSRKGRSPSPRPGPSSVTKKQDSGSKGRSQSPRPGPSKRSRDDDTSPDKNDSRPVCPFGRECYRKNPDHRKEFRHLDSVQASPPPAKKPKLHMPHLDVTGKYKHGRPLNFFLTTVHGIDREYNATLSMGIKDILSPEMGTLEASVQFNYMTDIPWLVQQYPAQFRTKPLLIVHGEQRQGKAAIERAASAFSHVKLCQAKLEIMYGTHHTKMMFLLYKEGLRVVIHTSNLIQQDWHQKTQGIWISPLFPKLSAPNDKGESPTNFKHDLLQYVGAYGNSRLTEWEKHIREHDMSKARVFIIGSIPGRHRGDYKSRYGHLKLRQILQRKGPQSRDVHQWPVVGQFSSIGSMGANKENWLCGEWLQSLAAGQGDSTGLSHPRLQLIYPSRDNVRLSLEGYPAGGSLPYSINTAKKQTFLHTFFHVWKSDVRGRSQASPHIKTYSRMSPGGGELSWFLVTSANLSKAAWGASEKAGSQLMIRSYELGVLFFPNHFGEKTFKVMKSLDDYSPGPSTFPVPYDLPPQPYAKKDKPWIWDIPYTDLPDTNGNAWCPS